MVGKKQKHIEVLKNCFDIVGQKAVLNVKRARAYGYFKRLLKND